ncbi:AMP-binding protein [Myxococcus sp. K38C18041901]|uniref:AMP-binding protein n=1 Tax=Myxococcus guangdongensis TaxID=2906760 RepID=UPI0020A72AA0|nr:AMP-binding protein [Myxococcus guangdongensis]MCP3060892.1 AMP-binding protein [Myxococcus guangdongensis]
MPFDLREILRQTEATTNDGGLPAWLRDSWSDAPGFIATLSAHHASRGGTAPKSRPGQHHDFFHDLVVRHADSTAPALRAWDGARWQSLGYRELADRASRRATEWAAQGVKAGAKVALVHPLGAELLVSLLASLKLGACITVLPPTGTHFLARRLARLEPAHISAEAHQAPLIKGHEALLLRSKGDAAPAFTSHTYKPGDTVALLFSPLVDPPDTPVPLTAERAWNGALVDGMLTYGLGAGEAFAAPGFHFLQHQPALLFAALLRGATYVHLEPAEVERAPARLTELPLRSLGVSPALREALVRANKGALRGVAHWFRSADDALDWESWRDWMRQCDVANVPHTHVLIDAAEGGTALASRRHTGELHTALAPAPGRAWAFKDLNLSGQEAAGDVGLFTPMPDKGRPPPFVLLTRQREQYLFSGTRDTRREGRVYPAAEVIEALADLPFCHGASVTPAASAGTSRHAPHVLILFTGAEDAETFAREQDARRVEVRRRLELRLGAEHLPDRVELFPLLPHRTKEGRIDEAWCRAQYLLGALHQKSTDPLFQALTALRGRLRESVRAPGEDERTGSR